MNTYDGKLFFKKDDGAESIVTIAPASGTFTAQTTAPSNAATGDRWLETSTGVLYTYFDGAWIEFGAKGLDDLQTVFSDPVVTRVGTATGDTSATLPAHQAGDIIIGWAFRDGSTTNPTLPAGWISLTSRDGTSCSARMGYKIAASAAETTGTWTNASVVAFAVYRGARSDGAVDPVADWAFDTGTSSTVNYDGNNITLNSDRTWVAAFVGHRSTDTTIETAPSNLTNVTSYANATAEVAIHDTNGGVSSFVDDSVSITGTNSGWITETVTIEPLLNPSTYLDFPSSPSVDDTYSYSNLTWKWNGVGWRLQSARDVQTFSSSGTWIKPTPVPSEAFVLVELWGAGGGGGSGGLSTASVVYGGGAGGGGEYIKILIPASDLPNSVSVTIGAGGTGGANSDVNAGSSGGSTSFGFLVANGGAGGPSSTSGTLLQGNGGSSSISFEPGADGNGSTVLSGAGGGPGGSYAFQVGYDGGECASKSTGAAAGGSGVGVNGSNATTFGNGGGGGWTAVADNTNATNGGNGATAGGGGGGGSVKYTTTAGTRGAGGNGGNGYAIITSYF
jgi:hypothetical protein